MSVEVRFIEANGLRFGYLEEGRGPLVLLLHGFPDTAHTWDPVRPKLAAKGYRAVSPFMRGYAPSGIPSRDANLLDLAQDAVALIAALGEPSAIVVGHDWGAMAAYGAASLEPSRVRKLITVAIPHPATLLPLPAKVWGVRHFFVYKLPGAAGRFAANDFAALPAICHRWSPGWTPTRDELADVRACFADPASLDAAMGYYRALPFRMPPHLRKPIEVPSVVFCGTGDPIASIDDYQRGARMHRGGYTIEQMPGGHFMHREHPDVFVDKLLAHL